MNVRLLALIVVALLLPSAAAWAVDASLVADTYVNSAYPAMNFGWLPNLIVSADCTVLLAFDLSGLPAGTTSDTVAKATLSVWINRVGIPGTIDVWAVTSGWTESGVTFGTAPTLDGAGAYIPVTLSAAFAAADLTDLVKLWVASPSSNMGIALAAAASAPSTSVFLDSKENTSTSHLAKLDITLTGPRGPAGKQGPEGPEGPPGPPGAMTLPRTAVSQNYTMLATDGLIAVDCTDNAVTVTLPLANSVTPGKIVVIAHDAGDAAAHNITVAPAESDKINGSTDSIAITFGSSGGAAYWLYSDGTNGWHQF